MLVHFTFTIAVLKNKLIISLSKHWFNACGTIPQVLNDSNHGDAR